MLYYNRLIIVSFCIYFVGVILGSLTYEKPKNVNITDYREVSELFAFKNKKQILVKIIKNNLKVVSINFSGVATFCVLSVVATFYNGFVLGRLVSYSLEQFGPAVIFTSILPHILEILAIILSCALSFSAGIDIFRHLKNEDNLFPVSFYILQTVICISIVFFSALMETYFSIGDI